MTDDLRAKARRRLAELERARADPRFRRALGLLARAGLLTTTVDDLPRPDRVSLADLLFAGTVEPRVLELLPAVVLKRPRLVRLPKRLPPDLEVVLASVREGRALPSFRGVPPAAYLPWIERLGREGRGKAVMRSFRLRPEDLRRLRELKAATGVASETEVLREALAAYERAVSDPEPE